MYPVLAGRVFHLHWLSWAIEASSKVCKDVRSFSPHSFYFHLRPVGTICPDPGGHQSGSKDRTSVLFEKRAKARRTLGMATHTTLCTSPSEG